VQHPHRFTDHVPTHSRADRQLHALCQVGRQHPRGYLRT
jgi:hypothetical protein